MRFALSILFVLSATVFVQAEGIPNGPFTQPECIACHTRETPDLVAAWRKGPHASRTNPANCLACHGNQHGGAMLKARNNTTCIPCHGGKKSAIVRSYSTSKHGVIVTLEGARWNWSKPLAEANYRAPTCAYCHMYEGGHGLPADDEAVSFSCLDCHAPRYTKTILEAAGRTLEIGELKLREAEAAVRSVIKRKNLSENDIKTLKALLVKMRMGTLGHLRVGLGHHSPDYQWWYGQAALDGDLLRIKAKITRLHRENER
jgi:hypothetical protein